MKTTPVRFPKDGVTLLGEMTYQNRVNTAEYLYRLVLADAQSKGVSVPKK